MPLDKWMEAHSRLCNALHDVMEVRPLIEGVPTDTALAMGEATGIISKVRCLLVRDIDNAKLGKPRYESAVRSRLD